MMKIMRRDRNREMMQFRARMKITQRIVHTSYMTRMNMHIKRNTQKSDSTKQGSKDQAGGGEAIDGADI